MSFEDFQQLARMYVLGALDEEELRQYREGIGQFGAKAVEFVEECRRLEAVFALSLQPRRPAESAKERLLKLIRAGRKVEQDRDRRTRTGKDRPLHGATEGEMSE